MKIKIAYQREEKPKALELTRLIKRECELDSVVKETNSDRHTPFFHIYLSITNLIKPRK